MPEQALPLMYLSASLKVLKSQKILSFNEKLAAIFSGNRRILITMITTAIQYA